MKRKWKILISCVAFALAVSAGLYWAYRHPKYDYDKDGVLKSIPTICVVDTFLGMPDPEDIMVNWHEWGETLVQQHYRYEEAYISHDATYNTTVRDGTTVIVFQGTGITADNIQEQIYDTVILPFELYGAE